MKNKAFSGARAAVVAFQIACLVPALFVVLASVYPYAMAAGGGYALFCDLGVSSLPRWLALGVSLLYRLTKSEVAAALALPAVALALGIVGKRLLDGKKTARVARIVLSAAIGADLVLRIWPLSWVSLYGWGCTVFAFLFRAACLGLLLWDLLKKKEEE